MSRLQIKILPLMLNSPYKIWIYIRIILHIFYNGVGTPGAFPKFVEDPKVFVRLFVALIVLDWGVDSYGFEGGFFPGGYDVPRERVSPAVVKGIMTERI